jgi:biotin carboxyl carrier protein
VEDTARDAVKYHVTLDGELRQIDVQADEDGWRVSVDGGPAFVVSGGQIGAAEWRLSWAGKSHRLGLAVHDEQVAAVVGGFPVHGTVVDPREAALDLMDGASKGDVVTQMPGVVVRVVVAEGDDVQEGDVLLIVEAMKMENEFRAPVTGRVTHIAVEAGQALEAGSHMLTVEPSA